MASRGAKQEISHRDPKSRQKADDLSDGLIFDHNRHIGKRMALEGTVDRPAHACFDAPQK